MPQKKMRKQYCHVTSKIMLNVVCLCICAFVCLCECALACVCVCARARTCVRLYLCTINYFIYL